MKGRPAPGIADVPVCFFFWHFGSEGPTQTPASPGSPLRIQLSPYEPGVLPALS
jgi:hypothetical protein